MRPASAASGALVALLATTAAEPPTVNVLFPSGGQTGTTIEVEAGGGKFDPWPAQAWTSDPGALRFEPVADQPGRFRATIAADAEPGPRLVRFFNAEGCSTPRQFVIGEHPEIVETEPNNGLGEAQPVDLADLPITVNGKLDPRGDVDGFAFDLPHGGTLVADVCCYALDSPIDPLMHVRDGRGARIGFNHDAPGLGLDPHLVFTAPAAGQYTVRLFGFVHPPSASYQLGGAAKAAYRITFARTPPEPRPMTADRSPRRPPFSIDGRIEMPDETDAIPFDAEQANPLVLRVRAADTGSMLDPVLTVLDADGKTLATADDIDPKTNPDVTLDWSPPADGRYTLQVTDRFGGGSLFHHYRVEAERQQPHFEATTTTHALTLQPGETCELAIAVARRYGHHEQLYAVAIDLPGGVTCEPAEVPDKGEAKLVLSAAPDAAPFNGPIRFRVGDQPVPVVLKGATTDAGDLLVHETGTVWLTVRS